LGKFRKLIRVDENLEPVQSLDEIFGKFPITCSKCFKELEKSEIILHCETDEVDSLVWVTPLHLQCGSDLCKERDEFLVPFKELMKYNKNFYAIGLEKMR